MTKKVLSGFWVLLLAIFVSSCGNMTFSLPNGPKGIKGRSAYEIWKEEVVAGKINWPKDQVEVANYMIYLKGEKGDKGEDGKSAYEIWKELIADGKTPNPHNPSEMWPADRNTETDFWDFIIGKDGKTPYIGDNGNWWIGTVDTKIYAYGTKGKDGQDGQDGKDGQDGQNGQDGLSAYEVWKKDVINGTIEWPKDKVEIFHYFEYLKGQDGKDGKNGQDGQNGQDGKDGITPHIGDNGNWWIGDYDTGVPARGQDGADGVNGRSAYEIWVRDVKAGRIKHPHTGAPWPTNEITMEDFWRYHRGAKGDKGVDGNDGLSAYEVWKKQVLKGDLPNPKVPGTTWPIGRVDVIDFYDYLTGPDGVNGKSAYDIWKKDLADNCGIAGKELIDHKTGQPWDCNKNTLDNFWEYLRGKDGVDGADGTDGKPGEPGEPGAVVTIIDGIPNVIAQYSQADFGEYVSTEDGSVTYKVYDDNKNPAPGAIVTGMPGIPNEIFTADQNGEFKIPREKLPLIADVEQRWGVVQSVTINGITKQSAPNTYVPNQMQMRLMVYQYKGASDLSERRPHLETNTQDIHFYFQRQRDPGGPWEDLPVYLPKVAEIKVRPYRVTDHNDPTTFDKNRPVYAEDIVRTDPIFRVRARRYTRENVLRDYNGYASAWDGQDNYYTVVTATPYYGLTDVVWDGVALMAVRQIPPFLKCITLYNYNPTTNFFEYATGNFDYDSLDLTMWYKWDMETSTFTGANGKTLTLISPLKYTEQEARDLVNPADVAPNPIRKAPTYIRFEVRTAAGLQVSDSSKAPSNPNSVSFKVYTPYLGAKVIVRSLMGYVHGEREVGVLEADGTNGYKIRLSLSNTTNGAAYPSILVKYATAP